MQLQHLTTRMCRLTFGDKTNSIANLTLILQNLWSTPPSPPWQLSKQVCIFDCVLLKINMLSAYNHWRNSRLGQQVSVSVTTLRSISRSLDGKLGLICSLQSRGRVNKSALSSCKSDLFPNNKKSWIVLCLNLESLQVPNSSGGTVTETATRWCCRPTSHGCGLLRVCGLEVYFFFLFNFSAVPLKYIKAIVSQGQMEDAFFCCCCCRSRGPWKSLYSKIASAMQRHPVVTLTLKSWVSAANKVWDADVTKTELSAGVVFAPRRH